MERLDHISNIAIDGLTVVPDKGKPFKGMALSNIQLNTAQPVECTFQNVDVNQAGVTKKNSKAAVLKANLPLKGGRATLKNAAGLKQ